MEEARNTSDGRPIAVVDASNVANSAPSAVARLDYLTVLVTRLEQAGYGTIIVADAGLIRRIDDRESYIGMVRAGRIRVAPPGEDADRLILELARELDGVVVSNDRFREWQPRYADEVRRRVGFRIRNGVAQLRGP